MDGARTPRRRRGRHAHNDVPLKKRKRLAAAPGAAQLRPSAPVHTSMSQRRPGAPPPPAGHPAAPSWTSSFAAQPAAGGAQQARSRGGAAGSTLGAPSSSAGAGGRQAAGSGWRRWGAWHRRRLTLVLLVLLVLTALAPLLVGWWTSSLERRAAQQQGKGGPAQVSKEAEDLAVMGQPSPAFCSRGRPPLVCAHGGDTNKHAANTRQAFEAALAMGVDCVEVDAALSSDGVLAVLHVRELQQLVQARDRAASRPRHRPPGAASQPPGTKARDAEPWYRPGLQVSDLTWAQLAELRWPGREDERVMRVADAVRLTSPFVHCVTLDVKTYQDSAGRPVDEARISEALVRLVHDTGCHNCLIWAKSDKVVQLILEASAGQATGFILMNQTQEARDERMDDPWRLEAPGVVGAYFGMVDGGLVERLHQRGKKIYVWTVNEPAVLPRMLDAGVDGVVTNEPELTMRAIDERLQRCGDVLAAAGRGGRGGASAPKG